jgi:hypothetical protein
LLVFPDLLRALRELFEFLLAGDEKASAISSSFAITESEGGEVSLRCFLVGLLTISDGKFKFEINKSMESFN